MGVRGTPNYVWFTEQTLGSGATGNVFCGRHKRMGEVCAVKVFAEKAQATAVQAKTRELELIKKLSHRNIVKLLAIEQETHTKEYVLVMELCSEGSVYDMINKPEYYFGFPESEYLIFIQDFASGLEYLRMNGIIHRDIKPGNILCSMGDDEKLVFKLTDFGSAHEQTEDMENFKSIRGTEEYLHPDIYGSALMGTKSDQQGFSAATDLWSIGATLYHVATGQLPFQPYGGRNNRETMYKIISEKKPGSISGIQKEKNGSIIWNKDLPKTCQLSRSLKTHIVTLISGTMEQDKKYQWKFEEFFEACRNLASLQRIYFYSGLSLTSCPLYLQEAASLEDTQKQLEKIADISVADQIWFYDNEDILSSLVGSRGLGKLPSTSEDNPIILWTKPVKVKAYKPDTDYFLEVPIFDVSSNNFPDDINWSREVCAQVIYYSQWQKRLLRAQSFLNVVKETICESSKSSYHSYELRFLEAVESFKSLQLSDLILVSYNPDATSSGSPASVSSVHVMIEKLQRLEKHIRVQFKEFHEDSFSTFSQQLLNCELKKCKMKFETYVSHAKSTYEQFKKDKDRILSYNEEQIHKYEKIKLNEVLKKSIKLLSEHCLFHTVDHYRKLVEWNCNSELKGCLDHIEKDLKKFISVCSDVFTSSEKNSLQKKFQQHNWPPDLSSGAVEALSTEERKGSENSELCPTATNLLSFSVFRVHLDLIRISQESNLVIQKEIEDHLQENDDTLNSIEDILSGGNIA